MLRWRSLPFWLLRVRVCPGSVLPHPPNAVLYGALRNACQDRLAAAVPKRAGRLSAAMNQSMNVTVTGQVPHTQLLQHLQDDLSCHHEFVLRNGT